MFNKARIIARLGNQAVHSPRPVPPVDALTTVGRVVPCRATGSPVPTPGGRNLHRKSSLIPPRFGNSRPFPDGPLSDQLQRLETELRRKPTDEKTYGASGRQIPFG